MGSENPQAQETKSGLDPAKAKSTSQLVAEWAAASGNSASSSSSGAATASSKRRRHSGASGSDAGDPYRLMAASRAELRAKLEERIAAMREERRRRQSEADRARSAGLDPAAKVNDKDGPEAGRLSFEPRQADLPFEVGVGRRGRKVSKLRESLRRNEADAAKLREAEQRGGEEAEQLRKDIAMRKAMARVRGEKVHDDPSKLRKAQKALELKKKKGKDKWASRVESDKQQVEEQQAQRRDNLAKRGQKKKSKRNGFEGKRSGYLNGDQ